MSTLLWQLGGVLSSSRSWHKQSPQNYGSKCKGRKRGEWFPTPMHLCSLQQTTIFCFREHKENILPWLSLKDRGRKTSGYPTPINLMSHFMWGIPRWRNGGKRIYCTLEILGTKKTKTKKPNLANRMRVLRQFFKNQPNRHASNGGNSHDTRAHLADYKTHKAQSFM